MLKFVSRAIVSIVSASTITAILPATAQPAKDDYGILSVVVENDLFNQTDKGYTSGVRASWVTSPSQTPSWAVNLTRSLPLFANWAAVRTEYAIQQSIFTPRDVTRQVPDPLDRPYAGSLSFSFGLIGEAGPVLDQIALVVGVVGPASLARESQRLVHDLRGISSPRGWDSQLRNEPTVQLRYQRSWRAFAAYAFGSDYGIDFTPHAGAVVGNVYTFANAGATFRIGKDLRQDFGPPRIGPAIPGSGYFEPNSNFGWYVFASLEGRAVARNIFLDGNTFVDGPRVSKNPLVGDIQSGVVMTLNYVRLSYTHVWRSREFKDQPRGDQFGAVSASVRW